MTASRTYVVTEQPDVEGTGFTLILTDSKGNLAHKARGVSLIDQETSRKFAIQGLRDYGFIVEETP